MATIIIDGYNVLGKANIKERDDLIENIVEYKKKSKHDVILFFDGTHNGTRFGDDMIIENIKVIYTPLHETADDHMIVYMEENASKEIMVVSSDRKIQKAATRHMFTYFESQDFIKRIYTKRKSLENLDDDDVEVQRPKITTIKKGNPRQLSKKEKRKRQSLKKI